MTVGILCFLGVWAVCGVLAYGVTFAHFQRSFPTIAEEKVDSDRVFAFAFGCLGPIGLLVALIMSGLEHGVKWRA